jgi:hypothetical protein
MQTCFVRNCSVLVRKHCTIAIAEDHMSGDVTFLNSVESKIFKIVKKKKTEKKTIFNVATKISKECKQQG